MIHVPDQVRARLWAAFADGKDADYWSGPQDAHWTAAVDRLLDAAAPLLKQVGREEAARDILEDEGFDHKDEQGYAARIARGQSRQEEQ